MEFHAVFTRYFIRVDMDMASCESAYNLQQVVYIMFTTSS